MNQEAKQIELAFINAFSPFRAYPRFRFQQEADHFRTDSGTDVAFLNNVFGMRGEAVSLARITEISEPYLARRLSFTWSVGPLTQNSEELVKRLLDCKFQPIGKLPGMIIRTFRKSQAPRELTFCEVNSLPLLKEWMEVWGQGFGVGQSIAEYYFSIFEAGALHLDPNFRLVVGKVEGKAVACANFYGDENATGIFNGTTLPDMRKKGYGAAVVGWCAEQALTRSNLPVYLFSSQQGFPVWQNLGFEQVGELSQFLRQRDA